MCLSIVFVMDVSLILFRLKIDFLPPWSPGGFLFILQRVNFRARISARYACRAYSCDDIIFLLSPYTAQRKGGAHMDLILTFLISVVASVVGYYVCKWLGRNDKDS